MGVISSTGSKFQQFKPTKNNYRVLLNTFENQSHKTETGKTLHSCHISIMIF